MKTPIMTSLKAYSIGKICMTSDDRDDLIQARQEALQAQLSGVANCIMKITVTLKTHQRLLEEIIDKIGTLNHANN
jgi:hypothetical protein